MFEERSNLGLSFIKPHQINKEVMINTNLSLIDSWLSKTIKSCNCYDMPENPTLGDKYIIPYEDTTENRWAGNPGDIAIFLGFWHILKSENGMLFWIEDKEMFMMRKNNLWCATNIEML